MYWMEVEIPSEWAILRVAGPLKSIGNLCCGVRNKRDQSMVNNGMQQKGSFSP